jgi:membrane dipeptidase
MKPQNMRHNNIKISRRDLLKRGLTVGAAVIAAPMISRGRFRLFANSFTEYSVRSVDLIKQATVIDMLSPFVIGSNGNKWFLNPDTFTTTDLQKYKDSGINVFHIAVGTGGRDAYLSTLRFISLWNGLIANNDEV